MSGRYPYQKLAKKLKYRILINDNYSYIERERTKEIAAFHNQLYTNLSFLGFSKQEILVMLQVYEWMKRFAKIASHSAKMERPVVLGKCK